MKEDDKISSTGSAVEESEEECSNEGNQESTTHESELSSGVHFHNWSLSDPPKEYTTKSNPQKEYPTKSIFADNIPAKLGSYLPDLHSDESRCSENNELPSLLSSEELPKEKATVSDIPEVATSSGESDPEEVSVIISANISAEPILFNPLGVTQRKALANIIKGMRIKKNREGKVYEIPYKGIGNFCIDGPTSLQKMKGDGACYFRSIAYAINGSQINHKEVRSAVTSYITVHGTHSGEDGVKYIEKKQMRLATTWATDQEIYATANLLQTDIYVYHNWGNKGLSWLKFAGSQVKKAGGIYLDNSSGCHFDVVLGVGNCLN